jgi:hypothetical protein
MALGADIYSIGADIINSEQTGRLVQKALQRSNRKKKELSEIYFINCN